MNVSGPEFQRLISTPPTESPAQGEPRPEIRVAPGQILRVSCLLRPGQGVRSAPRPLTAVRPPRPPGNLPQGCTRVHTGRLAARGSPGVPRVSPGRGGSPAPRPHSPGIPPPPGPALPALGVISLASLRRKGSAQAGGGCSPQVPARPTRKPAAAPRAAAQADLNTPARAGRVPRTGCAQGALKSDPGEGNGGISNA